MCGVIPSVALVAPLIDSIFDAIKSSPVRLACIHHTALLTTLSVVASTTQSPPSASKYVIYLSVWFSSDHAGPVFYFRQSVLISESKVLEMLEVICRCLDDENIEVREMAAT